MDRDDDIIKAIKGIDTISAAGVIEEQVVPLLEEIRDLLKTRDNGIG